MCRFISDLSIHFWKSQLEQLSKKKKKEIKGIQIEMVEVKLFILTDDVILYRETPEDTVKKNTRPNK